MIETPPGRTAEEAQAETAIEQKRIGSQEQMHWRRSVERQARAGASAGMTADRIRLDEPGRQRRTVLVLYASAHGNGAPVNRNAVGPR